MNIHLPAIKKNGIRLLIHPHMIPYVSWLNPGFLIWICQKRAADKIPIYKHLVLYPSVRCFIQFCGETNVANSSIDMSVAYPVS